MERVGLPPPHQWAWFLDYDMCRSVSIAFDVGCETHKVHPIIAVEIHNSPFLFKQSALIWESKTAQKIAYYF